jgi:cell division septation protein DedD
MGIRTRILTTLLLAVLAHAAPSWAQQTPSLDQVETLIKNGQTDEARAMFVRWQKDNAESARGLSLSARLTMDAQEAEETYLRIALSYPTTPYAAEALLRLGQFRLMANDPQQAVTYLQRVLSDYPNSEHRAVATEFLARAQEVLAARNPGSKQPAAKAAAPAPTPTPTPTITPTPAPNPNSRYTVQVAAFRDVAGARAYVRELSRMGYDARMVTVPASSLIRVRVGLYDKPADATAVLTKLKAAGYAPVFVSDISREQPVKN